MNDLYQHMSPSHANSNCACTCSICDVCWFAGRNKCLEPCFEPRTGPRVTKLPSTRFGRTQMVFGSHSTDHTMPALISTSQISFLSRNILTVNGRTTCGSEASCGNGRNLAMPSFQFVFFRSIPHAWLDLDARIICPQQRNEVPSSLAHLSWRRNPPTTTCATSISVP